MGRRTTRHRAQRVLAGGDVRGEVTTLAVEEPLEIRLAGQPFVVTMRTPGDDMDLAAGHLVSEGAVWHRDHLPEICYCTTVSGRAEQDYNTLTVTLSPDIPTPRSARASTMSSACGVCGVDSIDEVRRSTHFPAGPAEPLIDAGVLLALPERLREQQKVFGRTGGVHAAGLFTPAGELLCLREDVGRHNAVDKVVGWALRAGRLPLRDTVLQVSGRASFELVQKTSMAGIPVMAAVSAPSSLAVDLAEDVGVTLIGFSRGDRATVYTHPERIRD
ncbi:formate dehydrogenase accessory sulfurtransferase FdhD [Dietzia sp. CH92]|uniref:formate dehydrogenase accessory sulfurtransferase FdhD n=1 Tax=Dietzia sp. CH92 TaxID=3051823 RepID=UPI0028D4AA6F|nr:formate dehydrogenase accessory sulfurtransferase FdhD [Dietzia sp. CH92]